MTRPGDFQPLTAMRRIRVDRDLTSTQRLMLVIAALRTNSQGRVKASLEMLAKDAGVNEKTIRRALTDERVARYFTITRRANRVDLDWSTTRAQDPDEPESGKPVEADTPSTNPDTGSTSDGLSVPLPGHSVQPSASTSVESSASASEALLPRLRIARTEAEEAVVIPRARDWSRLEIKRLIRHLLRSGQLFAIVNAESNRYLWSSDRYGNTHEPGMVDLLNRLDHDREVLSQFLEVVRDRFTTEEIKTFISTEPAPISPDETRSIE